MKNFSPIDQKMYAQMCACAPNLAYNLANYQYFWMNPTLSDTIVSLNYKLSAIYSPVSAKMFHLWTKMDIISHISVCVFNLNDFTQTDSSPSPKFKRKFFRWNFQNTCILGFFPYVTNIIFDLGLKIFGRHFLLRKNNQKSST